jgi:phenylpyruvate tautomerase PptA (4-oxalocrotonate tautomerase family)
MAKIKLTKTAVDAATARAKDYELRDTIVPGFLLKVTPAGLSMLGCTGGLVVSPNEDLTRVERAIARIEEMPPRSRALVAGSAIVMLAMWQIGAIASADDHAGHRGWQQSFMGCQSVYERETTKRGQPKQKAGPQRTTTAERLTRIQKTEIVRSITAIHHEKTGAPRYLVQVIFHDLAPDSRGSLGGKAGYVCTDCANQLKRAG